mmetsp:Transcript_26989/g.64082  ORF Transcript_26989/g.64082 Transcript_26989/m.64082 type:complete len:227 (+) Transcript_26989:440-1120(+)
MLWPPRRPSRNFGSLSGSLSNWAALPPASHGRLTPSSHDFRPSRSPKIVPSCSASRPTLRQLHEAQRVSLLSRLFVPLPSATKTSHTPLPLPSRTRTLDAALVARCSTHPLATDQTAIARLPALTHSSWLMSTAPTSASSSPTMEHHRRLRYRCAAQELPTYGAPMAATTVPASTPRSRLVTPQRTPAACLQGVSRIALRTTAFLSCFVSRPPATCTRSLEPTTIP